MSRSVWRGDLIRAPGNGNERAEEGEALSPLATAMMADGGGEREAGGDSFGGDVEIKHLAFLESGRATDAHIRSGDEELSLLPAVFCRVAHEIWKRIFSDRQAGRFIKVSGDE